MKRVLFAAATLAVIGVATVGSAMAQFANTQTTPLGQTGDAAYPAPSNPPPVGTHYEWIFGYDRHGTYIGHWEVVRDR